MANRIVSIDIYVTPSGGSKIHIPVNPEKLQLGSDAKFISFTPISGGEVKIPNGSAPEEISWSSVFFGYGRSKDPYVQEYTNPNTMVSKLKSIRDKGTKCNVTVTGTKINGDYYISSFKGKYSGGYGDFYYDIKFVKAREIKITTLKKKETTAKQEQTKRNDSAKKKSNTTTQAKTTTYTIKSGDTLWGIAQSKLGSGSRSTEIYNLNKNVIEAAAKKYGRKSSNNGWWIYPGTKLTIPAK